MIYIKHRQNKIADIQSLDQSLGCEIDLRSVVAKAGTLHLSHDAWNLGDDFEQWLIVAAQRKVQGPIILNTKEDGLEDTAEKLMAKYKLQNYFFLDTTFPSLVKHCLRNGNSKFAVRLSKHEGLEGLRSFAGKAEWVWVDCFDGEPLPEATVLAAKQMGYKLCLVSPELQGFEPSKTTEFMPLFKISDAICTKQPQVWQDLTK